MCVCVCVCVVCCLATKISKTNNYFLAQVVIVIKVDRVGSPSTDYITTNASHATFPRPDKYCVCVCVCLYFFDYSLQVPVA